MFSTSQTAILSPNNCLMKVFIATFLVCANAHAALINYSEGAGDLDSAFTTSFTVDMAGVHSWSGSASIFNPQAGIAVSEIDFDSFQLVVDPGFVDVDEAVHLRAGRKHLNSQHGYPDAYCQLSLFD